jgi:hypothetical protein
MKIATPTAADVITALRRRLKTDDDRVLADFLGVHKATVTNWSKLAPRLTGSRMATSFMRLAAHARKSALEHAVRPIVELYPLDAIAQAKGDGWVMWDKKAGRYGAELRAELERCRGVYIFYDSSGYALYVGKAKGTRLWGEMNSAFNRRRAVQTVKLTAHPVREQAFVRGDQQPRQIRPRQLVLADIAAYMSAYDVVPEMINGIEALLVRAFPNDVLNVRMEKFVNGNHSAEVKAKNKVIRKKPVTKLPMAAAARRKFG